MNQREKNYLQGNFNETVSLFLTEALLARRDRHEVFKTMKSKDLQRRLLYPARLSFKIIDEIKGFPDQKEKVKVVH